MPKPSKGPRLGSGPAHERLLLGTLATQLIKHGKVETTLARAKRLRPYVERLITAGNQDNPLFHFIFLQPNHSSPPKHFLIFLTATSMPIREVAAISI